MMPVVIPNTPNTFGKDGAFNQTKALAYLTNFAVQDGFMRWRIPPDALGVGYYLDELTGEATPYFVTLPGKKPPREDVVFVSVREPYAVLKYYFIVEGLEPQYCKIKLHIILSLLNQNMRDMRREMAMRYRTKYGRDNKNINLCVNHMNLNKLDNYAYNLEWTMTGSNNWHGHEARRVREAGAPVVYIGGNCADGEADADIKRSFYLQAIISASRLYVPWHFGEFFENGINVSVK